MRKLRLLRDTRNVQPILVKKPALTHPTLQCELMWDQIKEPAR